MAAFHWLAGVLSRSFSHSGKQLLHVQKREVVCSLLFRQHAEHDAHHQICNHFDVKFRSITIAKFVFYSFFDVSRAADNVYEI